MTQALPPPQCRVAADVADDPRSVRLVELVRAFSPAAKVWVTTSQAVGELPPKALFSAQSKLARLGLAAPTAFQWVAKHEQTLDWNQIRTAADLRLAAAAKFQADSNEAKYYLHLTAASAPAQAQLAALRRPRAPLAVAAGLMAYEADQAAQWAAVLKAVNQQRLENVREWRTYLTSGNEEYAKDPFWQSCVWSMVQAALTNDRNHGLGTTLPLHKGALAALRQELEAQRQPISFPKHYERLQAEYARAGAETVAAGGPREWLYIPSQSEAKEEFHSNILRLQALSCPTWCTKTYNAAKYLERGGFWLLLAGATAITAIRLIGREIAEIQGPLNNGQLPPETGTDLEALLSVHPELKGVHLWRARNPMATPEVLAELANCEEPEVRAQVARHPNTTEPTLRLLAASVEPEVRLAVAQHPTTAAATLHVLAQREDRPVLNSVAIHPNVLPETLAWLGEAEPNDVRRAVAQHPKTPTAVLVKLAEARSKLVRAGVAQNPNTPIDTLIQLANDEYYGIRGDVAFNPSTPPAILANLKTDEAPYVRGQAAANPNTPTDAPICYDPRRPNQRVFAFACSARVGPEAFYDPETDTAVFLVDRIASVARAAALFFHELTHRLLAYLGRLADGYELKRQLTSMAPRLLADLPALLQSTGHRSLAHLKAAYGFDESEAGQLALLGELLARQTEQLVAGEADPSNAVLAARLQTWAGSLPSQFGAGLT